MNASDIRKKITHKIRKVDPGAEVYLFGSRARGDNRPDSDWDIIILVDEKKITNKVEDKFRNELYDVELESGQIISIFIYTKGYWKETMIHSPLHKKIVYEGVRL